jgi:hypothetical protein
MGGRIGPTSLLIAILFLDIQSSCVISLHSSSGRTALAFLLRLPTTRFGCQSPHAAVAHPTGCASAIGAPRSRRARPKRLNLVVKSSRGTHDDDEDEIVDDDDGMGFHEEINIIPSITPNEGIEQGDRRGLVVVKVLAPGSILGEGKDPDPGEGLRLSDALQKLDPALYPSKRAAKKHINRDLILVDGLRYARSLAIFLHGAMRSAHGTLLWSCYMCMGVIALFTYCDTDTHDKRIHTYIHTHTYLLHVWDGCLVFTYYDTDKHYIHIHT